MLTCGLACGGAPALTAAPPCRSPWARGGLKQQCVHCGGLLLRAWGWPLEGPPTPLAWHTRESAPRQGRAERGGAAASGQPLPTMPTWPLCPPRRQTSSLQPWCTSERSSRQVGGARPAPQMPRAGACLWVWEGGLQLLPAVHYCGCRAGAATCPGHALPRAGRWQVGGPSASPLARAPCRCLPGAQAAGAHCVPICG